MKVDPTKDLPREPSGEFRDAIRDSASMCVADCDLCGRVHFVSSKGHGDYEDGELERLKAKASEDPTTYVEESVYDCIGLGEIDGHRVVIHCPCNRLRRYEEWIWNHRDMICDYLKARVTRELDEARRVHKKVSDAQLVNDRFGRVAGRIVDILSDDLKQADIQARGGRP